MVSQGQEEARVTIAEEYEIWALLIQLKDSMIKARENEVRPFGTSSTQVGLMYVVKRLKKAGVPPTPSEISRSLFRQPATIYALLDRMEKQGLVELQRNSQGKRQVLVALTDKGEEVYRRQRQERKVIPRILGCLSQQERQQLTALLARLRKKTLEELAAKPLFL